MGQLRYNLSHRYHENWFSNTNHQFWYRWRLWWLTSRRQIQIDFVYVLASFHRSSFPWCSHKIIEGKMWSFEQNAFSFVFPVVYFEKHSWSAEFYAPQSSFHSLCGTCMWSYWYSSQTAGEWTCGRFRLYIWRLKLEQTLSFIPLCKTSCYYCWQKISSFRQNLIDKRKISFRKKNSTNCQVLELKFSNASDFEKKILQRVRFWFKIFTTRQILNVRNYNASDFELTFFNVSNIKSTFRTRVRFWIEYFATC